MRFLFSQSAILLFPAEKHIAASRTKGVVGMTGRATPTAPNANRINPNMVRIRFLTTIFAGQIGQRS